MLRLINIKESEVKAMINVARINLVNKFNHVFVITLPRDILRG